MKKNSFAAELGSMGCSSLMKATPSAATELRDEAEVRWDDEWQESTLSGQSTAPHAARNALESRHVHGALTFLGIMTSGQSGPFTMRKHLRCEAAQHEV